MVLTRDPFARLKYTNYSTTTSLVREKIQLKMNYRPKSGVSGGVPLNLREIEAFLERYWPLTVN